MPFLRSPLTYGIVLTCFLACNSPKDAPKTSKEIAIDSTLKQVQPVAYSNPDSVFGICTNLLFQSQQINYSEGQAKALLTMSSIKSLQGNYDTAIALNKQAYEKTDTLRNPRFAAEILNETGICYDYTSDYKKALDYYNRALLLFTTAKDTNGYVRVKNNIGLIYQNTGQQVEARNYFEEAVSLSRQKKYYDQESMALSNLASVENELGKYNLALEHFKEVLQRDISTGNQTYIASSYTNVGEAYKMLQQFDSAAWYYQRSIQIKEALNEESALGNSYKQYADLLLQMKNYTQAALYLDKAFALARNTGTTEYLQECYEIQSKLAVVNKNYQLAFTALENAHRIKDSIAGSKFKTEIITKEKDFQLFSQNVELQQQKEKTHKAKSESIIFIIATILFSALAVVLLLLFRRQKHQNKLLQQQQQQLENYNVEINKQRAITEEALDQKNKFLSFMAHEIRNPLGGIISLTDLLLDSSPTDEQKEYLEYQKKASSHLLSLLNEVLDYQKIVSGNVQINKVKFDLHDVLQQVYQLYSAAIKEKNLLYHLQYDKTIPAMLLGDPIRLNQVISNLLNNAIKFTPRNGMIRILVALKEKTVTSALIHFSIMDTGIGIAKEDQQKIFDLYQQAKTNTGKHGTGLGLTIVKNVLELMQSKVKLKSDSDQGTVISFDIMFDIPQ